MPRGKLIVLDHADGAGGTTHADRLQRALHARGLPARLLHEPTCALDTHGLSWRALALLYATDRAVHTEREILPELMRGRHVVCDRYSLTGVAYGTASQVVLDGDAVLDWAARWLRSLEVAALRPDLTLVLDAPDHALDARIAARGDRATELDRDAALQRAVRRLLRDPGRLLPDGGRVVVVDASGPVEATAAGVWAAVMAVIGEGTVGDVG